MNQTSLVAPSTIGMTAVSLLALGGPQTVDDLHRRLVQAQHEIDRAPLLDALEQCVARRLVTREGEVFASTLPAGWVVRSRASESEDPTGWMGWIDHSPDGRQRRLSDLQMELV